MSTPDYTEDALAFDILEVLEAEASDLIEGDEDVTEDDLKRGADDYLALLPVHERADAVLQLIALSTVKPADVEPPKIDRRLRHNRNGGGDEDASLFFDSKLRTKDCVDHIVNEKHPYMRIEKQTGRIYDYNHESHCHEQELVIKGMRVSTSVGSALYTMLGNDFNLQHVPTVEFAVGDQLVKDGRVLEDALGNTGGRIPFKNGLLNLDTGELEPFNPLVLNTYTLAVDYNPDAKYEAIPEWLKENTRLNDGKDQYDVLIDALTIVMEAASGKTPQKIAVTHGESRSGKGTLANNLICRMLDERLVTGVGLLQLASGDKFQTANLYNKILSVTGELPDHFISETSAFKMATGGDLIPAEFKGVDGFSFRAKCAFIMAGNHPPRVSDPTGSMSNRMQSILFPRSHAGSEDLALVARLEEEVEGLAYALVQAYIARRKRGGTFLKPHPQAQAALLASMNPLAGFVRECLLLPPDDAWTGPKTVDGKYLTAKTTLFKMFEGYMQFVGKAKVTGGMDRFLQIITRPPFDVRGGDGDDQVRASGNRRGYAAGINMDSEVVQAILRADPKLREMLDSKPQTKFSARSKDADTPPPMDEIAEVIETK